MYCTPGKLNKRLNLMNLTNCLELLKIFFVVTLLVRCMHCDDQNPFRYNFQLLSGPCVVVVHI